MKVAKKDLDIVISLTMHERRIELVYKEKSRLLEALDELDIEVDVDVIFDKKNMIASIHPIRSDQTITYKFHENLDSDIPVVVPDFKNSEALYKMARPKNAPFKILKDGYSIKRGQEMMVFLGDVETNLRYEYLSYDIKKFSDFSVGSNCAINSLSLSDILVKELLSMSSDEYYISKINEATNIREYISARHLTKLNELGINLTDQDVRRFIDSRNSIMHFKVVTMKDCKNIISTMQVIQHHKFIKLMQEYIQDKKNGII